MVTPPLTNKELNPLLILLIANAAYEPASNNTLPLMVKVSPIVEKNSVEWIPPPDPTVTVPVPAPTVKMPLPLIRPPS